MTKAEKNRLIAVFMGAKPLRERSAKVFEVENGMYFPMDCPAVPEGFSMGDRPYFEAKDLQYQNDWNSLMSVVRKLNHVIPTNTFDFDFLHIALHNADMTECFNEVVTAIEWCNKNKTYYNLDFEPSNIYNS